VLLTAFMGITKSLPEPLRGIT